MDALDDAVVVDPQQLDRFVSVRIGSDVQRGPTRVWMDVVWSGPAEGDEFVADPARERNVSFVAAMHMSDRTTIHDEIRFAILAGSCGDPRPASDRAPNALSSLMCIDVHGQISTLIGASDTVWLQAHWRSRERVMPLSPSGRNRFGVSMPRDYVQNTATERRRPNAAGAHRAAHLCPSQPTDPAAPTDLMARETVKSSTPPGAMFS
jgi:hypothetical protein